MEIKLFEVRDRITFISAIAIKLGSNNESERFLLARAGFGLLNEDQEKYILFGRLQDLKLEYNFISDSRTMPVAHNYIRENWNDLKSGDVIDIEYVLGEVSKPKESERNASNLFVE